MSKWLDRARANFLEKPDQGAAKRNVRTLTAATAAPHPAFFEKKEVVTDPTDGRIIAVEICSSILRNNGHLAGTVTR